MSKVKLSKEAIAKLRVVEEQILATPKFYSQYTFGMPTPCGTVCCIAGWLHYNEVGAAAHDAFVKSSEWRYDLRPEGSSALGLSTLETDNLFSAACSWPAPYGEQFGKAKSALGRAKVAVQRIEHFIETGE